MAVRQVVAAVAAAAAVTAGPAVTAAADESAQDTISRLQRDGYTVTVDKIGTGPSSNCVVVSVRNPQTTTQWVPFVGPVIGGGNRDRNFLVPVVTSQTISVTLDCSQR